MDIEIHEWFHVEIIATGWEAFTYYLVDALKGSAFWAISLVLFIIGLLPNLFFILTIISRIYKQNWSVYFAVLMLATLSNCVIMVLYYSVFMAIAWIAWIGSLIGLFYITISIYKQNNTLENKELLRSRPMVLFYVVEIIYVILPNLFILYVANVEKTIS